MPIKLIALDLDGTLLTSEKKISPRTRAVLDQCIERGIHIVPASGRMPLGLPSALREITGIQYMIAANGATVEDIARDRTMVRHSIFWKDALEVLDLVKDLPVMYDAYILGKGKLEERFFLELDTYLPGLGIRRLIRDTREGISDLRAYIKDNRVDVDKINLTFRNDDLRLKIREHLKESGKVTVTSSLPNNLELNQPSATKGNGLAFLCEYLHLKKEETIAFGDEENDLSMLRQAGMGIAMGNGTLSVREAADYITRSNDEDGIADAIEKFVMYRK